MQHWFHRAFAPIKRHAPAPVANTLRSVATAFAAPLWQAYRNGHFRSSFKRAAVSKDGAALPWYTYPCIHQLHQGNYKNRDILEFGGGHSTLWWQDRANSVLTFEADSDWLATIRPRLAGHATMELVPEAFDVQLSLIRDRVSGQKFDVVIIDGLDRIGLIPIAVSVLKQGGFILFDNAEWNGFEEGWAPHALQRVNYYGPSPGVSLQHCTSLFFQDSCFLFAEAPAVADVN